MRRLKIFLRSPRVYKDLAVAAFCALICLFLVMWIGVPRTAEFTFRDNSIVTLSVDNSILLSGFQCATVYWASQNDLVVILNGDQELPPQGSAEVCSQEKSVFNIYKADEVSYISYPILWINPFQLISCILGFVLFIIILSRLHWFAGYWSEAVFIGFTVVKTIEEL